MIVPLTVPLTAPLTAPLTVLLALFLLSAWHARASPPDELARQLWRVQDGLPDEIVQTAVQDALGFLWVGTTGGLARFDGSEFSVMDSSSSPRLPVNSVFCLLAASDESLGIGSEGGGLLRLRGEELTRFGAADGLSDPFVRALYQDQRGTLWVGTDNGLFVLAEGNRRVVRMDGAAGAAGPTAPIAVHAIAEDREHTLWVGGSRLLTFRADGHGLPVERTLPGHYSQNRVKSILPAADGTIWVGTVGGLVHLEGGRFHPVAGVSGTVRALHQTADGAIWIGTIGHGLWRWLAGRLEKQDQGDLLPSKSVLSITEDRSGRVWVGTQGGLVRLSQTPMHVLTLPQAADSDFATIARDRDGAVWAAMTASACREFNLPVHSRSDGEPVLLGGPAVHELSMMVREAIYNAALHGQPRSIEIAAEGLADRVRLRVIDDSLGFTPGDQPGHYGIVGMRGRATRLGGTLAVRSAPGEGTVVEVLVSRASLNRGAGLEVTEASAAKVRVMIVDDHPLMRVGIAAIIDTSQDMAVAGQCSTGEQAVRLYQDCAPDLVLMDLRLPAMSGVEAIRLIRAKSPEARFVVLTTYEGDEDIYQALEAGAQGYLIKGMPHETLMDALRRVNAGRRFLPPPVTKSLATRQPEGELSPREHEVLRLLVSGCSNREIAETLGIKEAPVKSHVSVILMRLDVTDRTQAVLAALRRGIVHL